MRRRDATGLRRVTGGPFFLGGRRPERGGARDDDDAVAEGGHGERCPVDASGVSPSSREPARRATNQPRSGLIRSPATSCRQPPAQGLSWASGSHAQRSKPLALPAQSLAMPSCRKRSTTFL